MTKTSEQTAALDLFVEESDNLRAAMHSLKKRWLLLTTWLRAKALHRAGFLAYSQAAYAQAALFAEANRTLAKQLGSQEDITFIFITLRSAAKF